MNWYGGIHPSESLLLHLLDRDDHGTMDGNFFGWVCNLHQSPRWLFVSPGTNIDGNYQLLRYCHWCIMALGGWDFCGVDGGFCILVAVTELLEDWPFDWGEGWSIFAGGILVTRWLWRGIVWTLAWQILSFASLTLNWYFLSRSVQKGSLRWCSGLIGISVRCS